MPYRGLSLSLLQPESSSGASIVSLAPATADAGRVTDLVVTATTELMTSDAVAVFNGVQYPGANSWQSSTESILTVPVALFDDPGTIGVRLFADGRNSNQRPLSVLGAAPVLATATPDFHLVAQPEVAGPVDFVIGGTGFYLAPAGYSSVYVNGALAAGEYEFSLDSPTQITLTVESNARAQSLALKVHNTAPGGGESAEVTRAVRYAVPTIESIDPDGVTTGAMSTTVTFETSDDGYFETDPNTSGQATRITLTHLGGDPVYLATTWIDANHVEAVIPASYLDEPAVYELRAVNPTTGGGGGPSAAQSFGVGFLAPTLLSVTPNPIAFNAGPTDEDVEGENFYPESVVRLDGVDQVTEYVSPTLLRFEFTPSVVTTRSVTVFNPTAGGGGGESDPVTLTVTVALDSMNITTATRRDNGFNEVVTGAGFVNGTSIVRLNGAPLVTTFLSSTQLSAAVPASALSTAGTKLITVFHVYETAPLELEVAEWTPGHMAGASTYGNSRNLLEAPSGFAALFTQLATGPDVAANSNAVQETVGARPVYVASDPAFNGKPSVARTTDSQYLNFQSLISQMVTASAGTILLVARPTAYGAPSFSLIVGVAGGATIGLYQPSAAVCISRNFDGGFDQTPNNTIAVGTTYKLEWRHEGGVVYNRVNAAQTSIASGDSTSIATIGRLFSSTAGHYFALAEYVFLKQGIAAADRIRWDNFCFQEYAL